MKLRRLTFSHEALRRLPEAEQLFLFRLAHACNYLRHVDSLCWVALNGLKVEDEVGREVALHQLLFAYRLLYGTLNEAWNIIQTGWDGIRLAKTFHERLSPSAIESLRFLRKYFSGDNPVRRVRNKFAYHYDTESVKESLANLSAVESHSFVTGRISGNVFYGFAEPVRNVAMIGTTDIAEAQSAGRAFYDEPHRVVYPHFAEFSDWVLKEIATGLGLQHQVLETNCAVDPRKIPPLLFVDEEAASRS